MALLSHLKEFLWSMWIPLMVILGLCCLLFLWCLFVTNSQDSRLPPGPKKFPWLGVFLGTEPHVALQRLGKKHGSVFSIRLGCKDIVVLNNYEAIKEGLRKDSLSGRPQDTPFSIIKEITGIINSEGREWQEHRNFALQQLRKLGFGKTSMEEQIQEEVKEFLAELKATNGQPFCPHEALLQSVANNICAFVFGKRFEAGDPKRIFLAQQMDEFNQTVPFIGGLVFFPWVFKFMLFFQLSVVGRYMRYVHKIIEFVRNEIENHKKLLNPEDIHDFIDASLVERQRLGRETSVFCDGALNGNVNAFFGGGSDSVRTALEWLLVLMAAYPDVQERVRKEVLAASGIDAPPSWMDRIKMPYTQAVIAENFRINTLFPLGLFRRSTEDTEVLGHRIPANTYVFYNLWSVHRDPQLWHDPDVFRPERFLSEDGTTFLKSDYLIPFATGKRSCPGEELAHSEVFIYFTSILQKFVVLPPPGSKANVKGKFSLIYQPVKQTLCFISSS